MNARILPTASQALSATFLCIRCISWRDSACHNHLSGRPWRSSLSSRTGMQVLWTKSSLESQKAKVLTPHRDPVHWISLSNWRLWRSVRSDPTKIGRRPPSHWTSLWSRLALPTWSIAHRAGTGTRHSSFTASCSSCSGTQAGSVISAGLVQCPCHTWTCTMLASAAIRLASWSWGSCWWRHTTWWPWGRAVPPSLSCGMQPPP